jgi:hypothetical protein
MSERQPCEPLDPGAEFVGDHLHERGLKSLAM